MKCKLKYQFVMKKFTRAVLIVFLTATVHIIAYSQNNDLTIGIENDSLTIFDLGNDEIVLGYDEKRANYYIDIDQNNAWDLRFKFFRYYGGSGTVSNIILIASDSTFFSIDTVTIQWIGPCDSLYPDTLSETVVTKYEINEVLKNNQLFSQSAFIARYAEPFGGPCIIARDINYWIGGIHYVGIKKTVNNINYLGWIKVEVKTHTSMIFMELAIQNLLLDIPEYTNPAAFVIYPNPANQHIYITNVTNTSINEIRIYNQTGQMLLREGQITNSIDISSLKHGIYVIEIITKGFRYREKLIIE